MLAAPVLFAPLNTKGVWVSSMTSHVPPCTLQAAACVDLERC